MRYLPRRRALTAVQLLGIAVGVASATGMFLSARTALDSFTQAVNFLQGQATHSLSRPAGGLEEGVLTRLMVDPAVTAFSPVLDRRIELDDGELVRVLGIDPFLDRRFRPGLAPPEDAGLEFLLEPRTVLADVTVAARIRAASGDLAPSVNTSHGPLRVVGTFPNPSAQPLFLLDIGHAQAVFGSPGRIDRVDLILRDPAGFAARWSQGFLVRSSGQQLATTGQLLRAFRLNLEALSLLGLFVGVFLIYNTAMFAVVSRKADAGILISLGAERREIAVAFLAEFLLLGGIGGLAGAGLGYGLSRLFTDMLGGTISSLYFFLRPSPPVWSWGLALGGMLLGWAACLLGGAFPLAELVRTEPVTALAGRVPNRSGRARADATAWVGLGVVALSVALFPVGSVHVYAGFAGAFGLLAGASLLCGTAVDRLGPWLQRGWQRLAGLPGRVAAGNVIGNLGRTAVAVAAFTVALSMSVGLGLMIGSFRSTMVWWMEGQLTGEVYIAPSAEIDIPVDFYEEVVSLGDLGVDPYRNEQILFRDTPVKLTAVSAEILQRFARFAWHDGDRGSWDAVRSGAVIVSESFWRRFGVGR
ncbi:MAG TPA: FtsX-like permease family protein, partial [Deferrisomatales bacterium]|nr:FtsX-like permease family protein [Deferrisomatales bacterium]